MDPHLLDGKKLGAFLITEVPGGEDEYGAVEGIARWDGCSLSIVDASGEGAPFPIPAHVYGRIRPVDENFRPVFESAEYYVPLVIKPLAEGAYVSGLTKTGHRWPILNDAASDAELGR